VKINSIFAVNKIIFASEKKTDNRIFVVKEIFKVNETFLGYITF